MIVLKHSWEGICCKWAEGPRGGLKRMKFQLCLLAVSSPLLLSKLRSDDASKRFPAHDPRLSIFLLHNPSHPSHDRDDDIWQTSSTFVVVIKDTYNDNILNWNIHAFKACVRKIFHNSHINDVQMWRVCMALFVWQGFPSQSFVPHQLMGISWWIVGTCSSLADFEKMWRAGGDKLDTF